MILPRLCINGAKCHVELYDPEDPDDIIAMISGSSKSICNTFGHMLIMSTENYYDGYNDGYFDAIDDIEE